MYTPKASAADIGRLPGGGDETPPKRSYLTSRAEEVSKADAEGGAGETG